MGLNGPSNDADFVSFISQGVKFTKSSNKFITSFFKWEDTPSKPVSKPYLVPCPKRAQTRAENRVHNTASMQQTSHVLIKSGDYFDTIPSPIFKTNIEPKT